MEHPTQTQWKAFLDGRLESAVRHEMAVHLDDCQACLEAVFSLPAPIYRALGRPVCPWLPLDPPELERQVAGFSKLRAQLHRALLVPSGGCRRRRKIGFNAVTRLHRALP